MTFDNFIEAIGDVNKINKQSSDEDDSRTKVDDWAQSLSDDEDFSINDNKSETKKNLKELGIDGYK